MSLSLGLFGLNTDTASIFFMISLNLAFVIGLSIAVYKTHNWEVKSIQQEVRETNFVEI